jgi:MFS family permease
MGFSQGIGHLNCEIDRTPGVERMSRDRAVERVTWDEFERQIQSTGIVTGFVQRGNVRMRDRHRPLRIGAQLRALRRVVLNVVGRYGESDGSTEPRIARAKHLAKPALAETLENPVVRHRLQDAAIILAALASPYLALLRQNRNFRLLYIGQAISQLGDWFNTVAVYALLLDLTGSATAVAWMLIVQLLPIAVIGPFAGVVVDRLNRRRIMMAADLLRGILILGLLLVRSADHIWIAYVVTACAVAATAFFEPARTATIPNVTTPEQLLPANALASATWSAMLAVGASVGGLVTAVFGRDAAFIINSASFFVSALFIALTRYDATPLRRPRRATVAAVTGIADLIEGLRYVRREAHVAALMLVKTGWGLAGGILLLLTIFGQRVFPIGSSSAAGIGVLYGARGVGAGLGPILLRWMLGQEPSVLRRSIGPAFFMIGIFYAALSRASVLPLAAACVLLAHFGGSVLWVFSTVLLQMEVPDEFRGRVFAAELALFTLTSALSSYLTGFYLDRGASPRTVSLVLGALFFFPGFGWMLILSRWRQTRVLPANTKALDDRDEVLRGRIT